MERGLGIGGECREEERGQVVAGDDARVEAVTMRTLVRLVGGTGGGQGGLLFLHADEEVKVANVVALVVEALNLAERRAQAVNFFEETQLAQHALAGGEEDKTCTRVDDNGRTGFEQDKVDTGAGEGVGCGETNRTATNDDDPEAVGAHLVFSCLGRWSSLVRNANLAVVAWPWYLENCDDQTVWNLDLRNSRAIFVVKQNAKKKQTERFAIHWRGRSCLPILGSSEVDCL